MGLERFLERRELLLWNRTIGQVKVQWKHLGLEEANWEIESNMQDACPDLVQEAELEE